MGSMWWECARRCVCYTVAARRGGGGAGASRARADIGGVLFHVRRLGCAARARRFPRFALEATWFGKKMSIAFQIDLGILVSKLGDMLLKLARLVLPEWYVGLRRHGCCSNACGCCDCQLTHTLPCCCVLSASIRLAPVACGAQRAEPDVPQQAAQVYFCENYRRPRLGRRPARQGQQRWVDGGASLGCV